MPRRSRRGPLLSSASCALLFFGIWLVVCVWFIVSLGGNKARQPSDARPLTQITSVETLAQSPEETPAKSWEKSSENGKIDVGFADVKEEEGSCRDQHESCQAWAEAGECTKNKPFMIGHLGEGGEGKCCKSCNACDECFMANEEFLPSSTTTLNDECVDLYNTKQCLDWAEKGECESNKVFMLGQEGPGGEGKCCKSCGNCADCFKPAEAAQVKVAQGQQTETSNEFFFNWAQSFPHCQDHHENCKEWAAKGECESNEKFMIGHEGPGNWGRCCKACDDCTSCWVDNEAEVNRKYLPKELKDAPPQAKDLDKTDDHKQEDESSSSEVVGVQSSSLKPEPVCEDLNENCKTWAENGECERNKLFTIGHEGPGNEGQCCQSCNACGECWYKGVGQGKEIPRLMALENRKLSRHKSKI